MRLEVSPDNNVSIASKATQYRIIPLRKLFSILNSDEKKIDEYEKIRKTKSNPDFIEYIVKEFQSKEMGGGFMLVKFIKDGA